MEAFEMKSLSIVGRRSWGLGACAALALAVGSALAQQQDQSYRQQEQHRQGQDRNQDQSWRTQDQSGRNQDQAWRTMDRMGGQNRDMNDVVVFLHEITDDHDTFLRIDNSRVRAFVDSEPVPADHIIVEGHRLTVLDDQNDVAAAFRLPRDFQLSSLTAQRTFDEGSNSANWQRLQGGNTLSGRQNRMGGRVYGTQGSYQRDQSGYSRSQGLDSLLGISVTEAGSRDLANVPGYNEGLKVDRVQPGTPAADAGLRQGEIIVACDNQRISSESELRQMLQQKSDESIRLTVVRDGSERTVTLRPSTSGQSGSRPQDQYNQQFGQQGQQSGQYGQNTQQLVIGITMSEADRQTLSSNNGNYTQGVRVDDVQSGLPAARAGLRPGDIVVAVDGQRNITPDRLRQLLQQHRAGDTMSLTILRDGQERTLSVRPERYEDTQQRNNPRE
jgi:hypothetical protein